MTLTMTKSKPLPKLYYIAASAAIMLGITLMVLGGMRISSDDHHTMTSTETFQDVQSIQFDLRSTDLTIQSDPTAKTCTAELRNVPDTLQMQMQENSLVISEKALFTLQFFDILPEQQRGSQIILTVPETLFDSLKGNVGSADVQMTGLQCSLLEVDTGAGDISLNSVQTDTLQISNGAGNIGLSAISVKERLQLKTGAGDTRLETLFAEGNAIIEIGAGDLTGESVFCKKISISNGAGDCTLTDCAFQEGCTLENGAGDVHLTFADGLERYAFDCSEIVGDVRIGNVKGAIVQQNSDSIPVKISGWGDVTVD